MGPALSILLALLDLSVKAANRRADALAAAQPNADQLKALNDQQLQAEADILRPRGK